jgi:DeoR family transcriptional regulator, fructose operon transcriptional repressor
MLAIERQKKIVDMVNLHSSVRVSELSDLFSVTEETIRRDLEKLENEKKLLRSHGGAVRIQSEEAEAHFSEREITNVHEKKAIALEAVKKVQEGDRLILDASTTAWYMAQILPDIQLTVITNAIKVAMELSRKEKINVISTGGTLQPKSLSFTGYLAESSLEQYHVNKVFLSCKGLHTEFGLSDSNESQALLKRKMLEITDQVYLMVDSSKIETRAFSSIGPLMPNYHLITDSHINEKFRNDLEERNIDLTIVQTPIN